LPGISVAVSEVGQLPYYAPQARILDLSGLNDAFIARQRFDGSDIGATFPRYLEEELGLPDVYIEPHPDYFYGRVERIPALESQYRKIDAFRPETYVRESSPMRDRIVSALTALR
jgi:hypothetical protein